MLLAEDIHKRYNKPVLAGATIKAERGQIIGIAGANGSGKSTLLSIAASAVKPDKGMVSIDGKDVFKNFTAIKGLIGFVPQENALFESLTVADNIKFWAVAYDVPHNSITLDKALLADILKKKVKTLSGGTKKKLALAIAMLSAPDFLILDEPTSALDINNREEIIQKIFEHRANNKAVIFTSHYAEELEKCDVVYVLNSGAAFEVNPLRLKEKGCFKGELLKLINA